MDDSATLEQSREGAGGGVISISKEMCREQPLPPPPSVIVHPPCLSVLSV